MPRDAEPREENQTLEVAQIDGDAETSEVTETHRDVQLCEEVGPQQSPLIHPHAYTYEHVGASDDAGAHRIGDVEQATPRNPSLTSNTLLHIPHSRR